MRFPLGAWVGRQLGKRAHVGVSDDVVPVDRHRAIAISPSPSGMEIAHFPLPLSLSRCIWLFLLFKVFFSFPLECLLL